MSSITETKIIDGILVVIRDGDIVYGCANPRPRHFRKAGRVAREVKDKRDLLYRVEFERVGPTKKLASIKVLRDVFPGLPLKTAKDIVDGEELIASGSTYECATRLKHELEALGNVVAVTEVKS